MPEHIRALIVILFVATLVFTMAKQSLTAIVGSENAYRRDRNLWFAITLIAFLSHNFWLYAILAGIVVFKQTKSHDTPLAMYVLVLFAVPPLSATILGLGPIDHIIVLDHYRLLSLTILLPYSIHLHKTRSQRGQSARMVDFFVVGLLLWMFCKRAVNDTFTGTVRQSVYILLDTWLPYYVGSRALTELRQFRAVAAALVLSCTIIAILAVIESTRSWLLYDGLRGALGLPETMTLYLRRGEGGALRANVSLGNAIVLGYVLIVALAAAIYLMPVLNPAWKRKVTIICLCAGLVASLSRGPWVGAAAMLLTLTVLGPGLGKRLAWLVFGGGTTIILLLISPLGDKVIEYLPFVGTVEASNVEYRSRLIDVSLIVFMQNPIVGDFYFFKNPIMEQMRQGAGIIDVVNNYLQIALPYGAIGLSLFVGIFLSALQGTQRTRRLSLQEPEIERLGRCLIGALVGMLVTIGTVSSIGAISLVYSLFLGICVSYIRVFVREK